MVLVAKKTQKKVWKFLSIVVLSIKNVFKNEDWHSHSSKSYFDFYAKIQVQIFEFM